MRKQDLQDLSFCIGLSVLLTVLFILAAVDLVKGGAL
ncbi:hypothetical protein P3T32_002325 [Ralstonia sp. GP73]|nr:hypothetical protein [Ralstonia sp. GP73]